MRRTFKAALAAAVAVAPLAGLMPSPASAQLAVVDIRAIVQMSQQLAKQTQMVQQQIQQYQNMLVNTASLPSQQWGQTMQAIRNVNQSMQQLQALSYQSRNIEQQIRQKYQGYNGYSNGGVTSAGMSAKYGEWSADTNASIAATMRGLGIQNDQLDDEDVLMRQLEGMGNTAQGRMQAAQVGNQLAAQAVRQTQKLRQLQMMQIQMQANYIAQQQDKDAMQAAAGARAYGKANYATRGGKAF